jgi:polysaccharide export outer membrane protein
MNLASARAVRNNHQRLPRRYTIGGVFGKEQVLLQSRVAKRAASASLLALCAGMAGGCGILDIKSFGDPSEMFTDTKKPLQKPILSSLSSIDPSIDDPDTEFFNATDVTEKDRLVIPQDYKIGKGDQLTISVNDLMGLGVETTKQTRVTESGNISMNLLGQIHAEGLTEDELQRAIADGYKDKQIIPNAQVTVTVVEARARTFSALGAVNNPGEYAILKADFKLLDALVLTRDVLPTTTYLYIIRQISEDPGPAMTKPMTPMTPQSAPPVLPEPGKPGGSPADSLTPHGDAGFQPDRPVTLQTSGVGGTPAAAPAPGFQFVNASPPPETRTIRVPLEPLRNGDLKYNIIIRPHDLIIAPNPVLGEYYIGGHVNRVGVYSIPTTKITIKQAVIAAGMLDGLAIPERTELIRRIGPSREAMVRIDVNAIFSGTQPDIFLRGNDELMVGTNVLAPFISDLRNGFRITYGFGFLYDRNYAPSN